MLTLGIIVSIDYLGNKCAVRLPLFETSGTAQDFVAEAALATPPGVYNGYCVDDRVVVGFGSGGYGDAIVIGKLYLGVSTEKGKAGGTVKCSDFVATNSATLPGDTKIDFAQDSSKISNAEVSSLSSYDSLRAMAEAISANQHSINALRSENDELRAENADLLARVEDLERRKITTTAELFAKAE